jgi:hypothetical protein
MKIATHIQPGNSIWISIPISISMKPNLYKRMHQTLIFCVGDPCHSEPATASAFPECLLKSQRTNQNKTKIFTG